MGPAAQRELEVRTALGASHSGVTTLVFRQGMTLAVLGVGLECAALDPATFVGCSALMLLIAMCAVYVPVRRATSVDPVVARRAE